MNNLFIAWIKFQRRAVSMQPYFQYKLKFFDNLFHDRKLKIIDYLYNSFRTLLYLIKAKPSIIWIQLPPTPLLYVALIYRFFFRNTKIVADCHNGLFSNKWIPYLKGGKYLNKVDIIIVHNNVIKDIALKAGLLASKVNVLETKPADQVPDFSSDFDLGIVGPWVLMPCAFADDEPISVVFEAAKLIPDNKIVISGNTKRAEGRHDLSNPPDNVILTGYLSTKDYEALILKSSAILGLTTEKHIQLSVANEATGFEKPMILSNTALLKELFNKGAVFVDTMDSSSIAYGITSAISSLSELEDGVKQLKIERNIRWSSQADIIKRKLYDRI